MSFPKSWFRYLRILALMATYLAVSAGSCLEVFPYGSSGYRHSYWDDDLKQYVTPSCFAAGTKVLMADGGRKNIEDVRAGDRVLGMNGAVNTVTGIERPRLGVRLLYAFNGGRPFMTAEHPVMTANGWRSIDPKATRAENPRFKVGALGIGDRLVLAPTVTGRPLASGGRATRVVYAPDGQRQMTIVTIKGVGARADTFVYNLKLDGNHTYFADGYLVHNKAGGE